MSEKTGLERLLEPFDATQINLLPRNVTKDDKAKFRCEKTNGSKVSIDGKFCGGYHAKAVHLDYVGHAALTKRLLESDIKWGWEPLAVGDDGLPVFDRNGGLWIRLTVAGVTRLGYGDAQGKTGGNAVKEAIGDALRNAGMRFGAALDLWHKGDLHDAQEERNPTPPAPAAGVDQVLASEWVEALNGADSIQALQSAWEGAGKAGVTRDPKVIAAKDLRKRGLS